METMSAARFLRIRHGVTLRELADAAGVSVQYMSEIELNESRRTKGAERLTRKAFETVITQRGENAKRLAEAFAANRDALFSMIEEDANV